jgi:tight adherence protein C
MTNDLMTSDWMMIGTAALFGLAVFLLIYKLYPTAFLKDISERADDRKERGQAVSLRGGQQARETRLGSLGGAFIEYIGNYCEGFVRTRWAEKMKKRYLALGKPEYRPQDFIAQQFLFGVFFGMLSILGLVLLEKPLYFAAPFFVFGFFFPYLALSEQIKKRQKLIVRMLPYHIDLLTLSVEAGLDFGGAMQTVVEKGRPGPLLEELGILIAELKFGKTREEALRNFAARLQIQQVSTFVSNVVQAEKMGTSLGKVLRIQSGQMRVARAQRAEKLANEAPIKMLFPLVLCFFPTVFMILFGPIIYRLFFGQGL